MGVLSRLRRAVDVVLDHVAPLDEEDDDGVVDSEEELLYDDDDDQSSSADQDDAADKLKELARLLSSCRDTVAASPATVELASWHLEQANERYSWAKDYFAKSDYDETVSNVEIGTFHASLAQEVVLEYRHQSALMSRLEKVPAGAEDVFQPDYCCVDDDEMSTAVTEWRKLSLLVARAKALCDAYIDGKHPAFVEGAQLAAKAEEYVKAAEDAKSWEDVPAIVFDGLFFARLSLRLTLAFLLRQDIGVQFDSPGWDTSDSYDDDDGSSDDARESIAEMLEAVIAARRAVNVGAKPCSVAAYHLSCAASYVENAFSHFWDEEWDDADSQAIQGRFHADVAGEAAVVYGQEGKRLAQNLPSTALEENDGPDPDYIPDGDDERETACAEWRNLSLKVAKLQSWLDQTCPEFQDGYTRLKDAQDFVVQAEEAENWEDIPPIAQKAIVLVEIADEAITTHLANSRANR